MKKNLSKIVLMIDIFACLLVLGSVYIWAPVCDGLLTLDSGRMVHMKCFYTGQSSVILSIIMLAAAVAAFFSKQDHNKAQWIVFVIGALLIANTFESIIGIGICKMSAMACHTTAAWIRFSGALAIAGGIIDITMNNSNANKLAF